MDERIEELLEKARNSKPMTPDEAREQRISFVYGQLMDCAPEVTKEQIAEIYDAIYGGK